MNENDSTPLPVTSGQRAFSSVADCTICRQLPQKAAEDREVKELVEACTKRAGKEKEKGKTRAAT